MAKHKKARRPPQHVQRAMSRRRKNPLAMRLRSRHRGKWCAPVVGKPTIEVCAVGAKYGVSAMVTKNGAFLAPISVRSTNPAQAVREAARNAPGGLKIGTVRRVR